MRRWLLVVVLLLALAGCGRVENATTPADELSTTCHGYAEIYCSSYHACYPDGFEQADGDEARCIDEQVAECVSTASLRGVVDGVGLMRCRRETLLQASRRLCRAFHQWVLEDGPGCVTPGTLPAGDACEFSGQCASGRCYGARGCARCAAIPTQAKLGESCAGDVQCPKGTLCAALTGVALCRPYAEEGESCVDTACHWGQHCKDGRCVSDGEVGEACEAGIDCMPSTVCSPATSTCNFVRSAKPGEKCALDAPDDPRLCTYGYRCASDASGSPRICRPGRRLGESCAPSGSVESDCLEGRCSVASICEEAVPSSCP